MPPLRFDPGAGGLFITSLIRRQFSSSLSVFDSCVYKLNKLNILKNANIMQITTCSQKNVFLLDDLNFSTYTLPVVHCDTYLNSQSSGNIIKSFNTINSRRQY